MFNIWFQQIDDLFILVLFARVINSFRCIWLIDIELVGNIMNFCPKSNGLLPSYLVVS
jgi:hypothetical protein